MKFKQWWEYLQDLLDVRGDVVMLAFTTAIIMRLFHGRALNPSEAAVYSAAIGAFAYSNKGPKQL